MDEINKEGLNESEFLNLYDAGKYPRPSLTADILLFARENGKIYLLMIKRADHPFIGKWALPGGFVNPDESADEAAIRELEEETHIKNTPLIQLGMFSTPKRDPRTWVVTEAYIALLNRGQVSVHADDDANEAEWFSIDFSVKNDILTFSMQSGSKKLSSQLKLNYTATNLGTIIKPEILSCSGIAFDHAKIISHGLFFINKLGNQI